MSTGRDGTRKGYQATCSLEREGVVLFGIWNNIPRARKGCLSREYPQGRGGSRQRMTDYKLTAYQKTTRLCSSPTF